eukprot:jgi/Mesvir1/10101/Mv06974-RA.1
MIYRTSSQKLLPMRTADLEAGYSPSDKPHGRRAGNALARLSQVFRSWPWAFMLLAVVLLAGLTALVIVLEAASLRQFGFFGEGSGCAEDYMAREAIEHPYPWLQDLVLVACHAVYVGHDHGAVNQEGAWALEPYQKTGGFEESFMAMTRAAIEFTASHENSMLLFSGGQTRPGTGPRSEAQSYWQAADARGWFGFPYVRERAFAEEFARDSFENLLFSLCRFHELTGRYPRNVTVVSYSLKRRRFTDVHRNAVAFPSGRFNFVGLPLPTSSDPVAAQMYVAVAPCKFD